MHATPSALDSSALARRLGELAGDERNVQVDFLLHLDEFDRRRAYLEIGFGSLWDYCLKSLHLREGAAGRRIGAMRVLRRFPRLEGALRDGRLCLSTVSLLGQVLTDENLDDVLARAAFKTKAEVEHLVASMRPREAPRDGIRKLPTPAPALNTAERRAEPLPSESSIAPPLALAPPPMAAAMAPAPAVELPRPRASEVRPVSQDEWSVRVTLDSAGKAELEALKTLLSHKIPNGDLAAVLREAIRCGIEKHGKRRGAVPPSRLRESKPATDATTVTAEVRRAVWERDGGACTWVGEDGRRCGSRWQLEIDHVRPPLLGGSSAPDDLRVLCRPHNMLHAEQIYGREHMERFRRDPTAQV
jgi:hypothetical protein